MRCSTIFYLGCKELRSLGRDPVLLFMIVWVFTVGVYTAATALPDSLNKAPIAIVDEDKSPLSMRLASAFYPPQFLVPEMISQSEMDRRMDMGLDTFSLDIPPDFQKDLLARRTPTIQLNIDATRMSQAFAGNGYIQTIISAEVAEFMRRYRSDEATPVDLNLRVRFNPNLIQAWFGSVMEMINNVTMLAIILTGASLIREREHGTVEHLLVMPVTPFDIMVSKIWSMALVVTVACIFSLVVVIRGILAVQLEGALPLFLAGTLLHLFATTSMGIYLGTVARSMPQLGLLMVLILLPLQMLSGGVTPRESMPVAVKTVMEAAPTTHFVALAHAVLYRGAEFAVIWPQFIALGMIGIILFGVSLARFRRTIGLMA
ncbi:ABC transporter permease [Desulfobulbus propionicus]